MPSLGVTGGIATGKTTVSTVLARSLDAEVFDADQAAHTLLATNETVKAAVRTHFGSEVFAVDGNIERALLRQVVFSDDDKRKQLEQILHPQIRQAWVKRMEDRQTNQARGWLLIDIPLLFETKAERYFDAVVVVACSTATQLRRLQENRNLPSATAQNIMAAQLNLTTKIQKADYVIWNDGALIHAQAQADMLAAHLKQRHG